ncbi:hypothetical protein K6U06_21380 [Acidiferrimicrobium sp. IK]|uniref:hypothetical protein n=1 Tax=Acidiferrimicrobium sp. IK TaxID=2871700 RepID=UPI0021CB566E|nr:hypothetical protein [Acidiferrimicrobium sp. IK]MCU4186932.1 hypothetical protein [Acidiferrimicrobium sp. IK]
MASPADLRRILEATSLPADLVDEILGEVGTPWLMGAPAEVVAGEAVLCHPPLAAGEVRAVANPTDQPGVFRLTVVAEDRPGLLAGTAGALASEGLSVVDAATTVLPRSRLALQRVAVLAPPTLPFDDAEWERVGHRLRAVLGERLSVPVAWAPEPPVVVETQPQQLGRVLVTVRAPDRIGLLHAAASWFEGHGCNVEACHASSGDGTATDVFLIAGHVDPPALAAALGGAPAAVSHGGFFPVRLGIELFRGAATFPWRVAGIVGRALRGPEQ